MAGICLARIVRPQGRHGEVRAAILTDFPDRLVELRRAFLAGPGASGNESKPVAIRSCRIEPSRRFAIFHFEGSDSIEDAERLIGWEVQVPASERMPLPDGSYYVSDLVGCELIDSSEGSGTRRLGSVRGVQPTGEDLPGTPILVVEAEDGRELLVPLATEICRKIDLAARRIEVTLPEGLAELNREKERHAI